MPDGQTLIIAGKGSTPEASKSKKPKAKADESQSRSQTLSQSQSQFTATRQRDATKEHAACAYHLNIFPQLSVKLQSSLADSFFTYSAR